MNLKSTSHLAILALFSLTCLGCVGGNMASGALLRPLRVPVLGSPSLPHQDFSLTSGDGITLSGWLFSPAEAPKAVMVLVHGKDINRQHFQHAAEDFVRKGWGVVAFDQRAHGRSTGEFVTYGAKEVGDLRLVLDLALEKWGRELPVVLVGESLGAARSITVPTLLLHRHGRHLSAPVALATHL